MKATRLASYILVILVVMANDQGHVNCAKVVKLFSVLKKGFVSSIIASSLFQASAVNAASGRDFAALADVGLREFLVKDGRQWLRLSQPGVGLKLGEASFSDKARQIQENLELVRLQLEQVGFSNPTWSKALQYAGLAQSEIIKERSQLVEQAYDKNAARVLIDEKLLPSIDVLISTLKSKDQYRVFEDQEQAASLMGELRELALPPKQLPYEIPEEYIDLPRLAGRAKVEISIRKMNGFRLNDDKTIKQEEKFILTVDGFHHPLTAGNFITLVKNKFYDGMTFQRCEELTVQTGKLADASKEAALNKIPLELFYRLDSEPVYGITADSDGRNKDAMALPFQAYGAIGMARDNDNEDSANSQFFILKWRQALVPPGRNTLDGFFTCFGYITSGNEYLLSQITPKDTIVYAKVLSGLENLIPNGR